MMRLEKNLTNLINHENVALEGYLICDCKNDKFYIYHTGVQKNGLFGSTTLKKLNKQIVIKAKCSKCTKEYLIYDSTIDGIKPNGEKLEDFHLFTKENENFYKINIKYNFTTEHFNTDQFEMIFIDIINEKNNKEVRIFEGE